MSDSFVQSTMVGNVSITKEPQKLCLQVAILYTDYIQLKSSNEVETGK